VDCLLPKSAPRPIVGKPIEVARAAMETPEVKERMLDIGVNGGTRAPKP
jgi:hypothetical protein